MIDRIPPQQLDASKEVLNVYHNDKFTQFWRFTDSVEAPIKLSDLFLIARVSFAKDMEIETALDRAFYTTQHLGESWIERPVVDDVSATKPFVADGRSTSVGDVIAVRQGFDTQSWWGVAAVGFVRLIVANSDQFVDTLFKDRPIEITLVPEHGRV